MEELNALKEQIDLTLFCDLIVFITSTTKATPSQLAAIRSRCLIPIHREGIENLQEKYGFLYLGELLERYEERFGMSLPALRAIALSLAYTKDLVPEDMFIGTQRADFLQRVRRAAGGDTYLTGAWYLLQEGQSGSVELENTLTQKSYQKTEELLFALSLLPEKEEALLRFKPQLLRLLGQDRSTPLLGNMRMFAWLINWLRPLLKQFRTKDMALFRALCALPTSFVKEGDRYFRVLSDAGFTPLEIAYANIRAIWLCRPEKCLDLDSVVTEKIIVNLFQRVLDVDSPLAPEIYETLSKLFARYKNFSVKCCGCHFLLDAFRDDMRIRDLETFRWFSTLAPLSHTVFWGFDILDPHWDALSSMMNIAQYTELFEYGLDADMGVEEIRARIARFDLLTGRRYLDGYYTDSGQSRFSLMANKEVIDLWDTFQKCLDENGAVVQFRMIDRLRSYLRNIRSLQAFRFFEKFLPQYGHRGAKKYFGSERMVVEAFADYSEYSWGKHIIIRMDQPYLDDEKRRLVLYWLSEFFFREKTDWYLHFILALLTKDTVSRLFPYQELRALYELVITDPQLTYDCRCSLKHLYQTEEEKEADRLMEDARRREEAAQKELAVKQQVQTAFEEMADGTMRSFLQFLKQYRFSHSEEPIAQHLVYQYLKGCAVASLTEESECICLLELCTALMKAHVMRFSEAREIMDSIKEVPSDGANHADGAAR